MCPIKIKDGVASIIVNASRKLTKRQLDTLRRTEYHYGPDAGEKYLQTLLGMRKGRVDIRRSTVNRYSEDKLKSRPSGTIRQLFENLQYNNDDANHTPSKRSPGAWIGVEIECYFPSTWDCNDDCDHYNGECNGDWHPSESEVYSLVRAELKRAGVTRSSVKSDGSLEAEDGIGMEVTLLFNTDDGFGQLDKVCGVLRKLNCFVNNKCGLHVHLDARHLKPKGARLIGQRLGRALPVLKWIVDPSRHDNYYCKMDVSPWSNDHDDRYHAVNLVAFRRYKTVEVRMHGGSTNPRKIRNWIELIRFIAATRASKTLETFQDLIDLGTPTHLVEYADKRITRLNPDAWSKLIPCETCSVPPEIRVEQEIQDGMDAMLEMNNVNGE